MSLEQYKDANRKELWDILQIQVERIAELEEEKLHMQISMTCVRELISVISAFVENIEPRSSQAVTVYNQCMEICSAIDDMDLPEFEFEALKETK
jgi:hypothetical protein